MSATSGRMELWRRIALLLGILIGLALFFFVAPAMISVTAVDWTKEQADELKSFSGYVTQEEKRLSQLPVDEYIRVKTDGKVVAVDSGQWWTFFEQVSAASNGDFYSSAYGERVSDDIKDDYWYPALPTGVYFKPDEIPYAQWGLLPYDGNSVYVKTTRGSQTIYLELRYQDYSSSVGAMSSPFQVAPGWLYHPYRTIGSIVMAVGLLLYIFLPRRKKQPDEVAYTSGSMLAGDIAAVILILPFYGLPYLINGGTVQAFTGLWPVTAVMWSLAVISIVLFYYNAWYSSYRIEITPQAIYIISFKGVRECRFSDMAAVNIVSLSNPGWFRKLIMTVALLSMLSGGRSTQPVGSALLAASATYSGLEIRPRSGGKPVYIWATNQMGGVMINNIDRVMIALEAAGVAINQEPREIEGFTMFMQA